MSDQVNGEILIMPRREIRCAAAVTAFAVASVAANAGAQRPIVVRDAVVVSTAPTTFTFLLFGVKEFANGTLLVNDGYARRMSVLDSTLQHTTV